MSMQRVVNYGSFLQAYGLKNIIEKQGHEVEFVDYTVEPCIVSSAGVGKKSGKEKIKDNLRKIKSFYLNHFSGKVFERYEEFEKAYREEYLPIIGVSDKRNVRPQLDCLVIGSDEVFNCLQSNPNVGYSKELFGAKARANKIISYAGSFGSATLEGLRQYKIDQEITEMFKKFDAISVRDQNSYEIVKTVLGSEPECNLDPVLMYDYSSEMMNVSRKYHYDKYIIVYAYSGRITAEEKAAIRGFAEKVGAKIVGVGVRFDFCDECIYPTPFEVLCLFKEASYIVTDTFHGSIMSIKFNRPFAAFVRSSGKVFTNLEKLRDLLVRLKLEDRVVGSANELESKLTAEIDYSYANNKISEEQVHTDEYLKKSI